MKNTILFVIALITFNAQAQENGEFEEWSSGSGYEEPDNWVSLNLFSLLGDSTSCLKSTASYSGKYCALLRSFYSNLGSDTLPSLLLYSYEFSRRPNSLRFAYHHKSPGSDPGNILVEFYKGNTDNSSNLIGSAEVNLTKNLGWQKISKPITWTSLENPDTLLITIFSGENFGSELKIDDISLSAYGADITSFETDKPSIWFNNSGHLFSDLYSDITEVQLYQLDGKLCHKGLLNQEVCESTGNLQSGLYLYRISDNNKVYTGKILKP